MFNSRGFLVSICSMLAVWVVLTNHTWAVFIYIKVSNLYLFLGLNENAFAINIHILAFFKNTF